METTTLDNWMEDLDDKLNTTNVDLIALITKHLKYFEKQDCSGCKETPFFGGSL